MSLDVRLGRRPAKASDVLRDKREVLELSLRGLGGSALRCGRLRLLEREGEFFGASFDRQSYAIREVKAEPLLSFDGGVGDGLATETLRERFGGQGSWWHKNSVLSNVWKHSAMPRV